MFRPQLRRLIALLVLALPFSALAQTDGATKLTKLTQFAEFGEPKYAPGFAHFDYVNPDAPKGGDVRLASYGTFERLDTIVLGPEWADGIGLTGDALMVGSADEIGAYYPSIAESVEVPDDLSFAVFNINPKARWQDGEPITAEDFVFAIETVKRYGRPLLKEFYKVIDKAEALDEHRVRFDFATNNNWKTVGLAASQSPLPKHHIEANGIDVSKPSVEPTLYEGGYTIERVDPGRSITYKRVDDFWGKDLPVNEGAANFDRITYVYFRDLNVAFEAFKAGEFDYWSENEARRWATGYDFPAIKEGYVERDESIAINAPRGFAGMVFNTRRPKFQDVRVREALSYLFDFEWTKKNIFYGAYERSKSYFPNSDYGTRDFPLPKGEELAILEDYRGRVPDAVFTTPYDPGETDGSGRVRRELRKSLGLLEQAGWSLDGGRLVDGQGRQMQVEIVLNADSVLRVVEPYINNLKRAGIDARARIVDSAQYQRITDDFDYDMIFIGANFFPPPGDELRTYFLSAAADEKGSGNWAGVKDPVVDELLARIGEMPRRSEADLETLKALTRALDRVLLQGHYIVNTYYAAHERIAYWDLFGRPEQTPFYGDGFPGTWWWDPAEAALRAEKR